MTAEPIPCLSDSLHPPVALGTAAITEAAFRGADRPAIASMIARADRDPLAAAYDTAIALIIAFRRAEALDLQDEALAASPLIRIRGAASQTPPLRLLALCTPGDLMVNTPLDFITNHLDVRLDLLHLLPDRPLPPAIPDHDIAFVATSESDPATVQRLADLFDRWPRPILNDPRHLPRFARDTLAATLAGVKGIRSPAAVSLDRARLDEHLASGAPLVALPPRCRGNLLIRPHFSHAGAGLRRIESNRDLRDYLLFSFHDRYYVTEFVDYAGVDGMFRKYRIAFIEGAPFLCHMASSTEWMIHYLNAGMTEHAERRDAEAAAMAEFDTGFAARHRAAFAALTRLLGSDMFSIDCGETPDGRLLVFEADTAAIVHMMDPPDMFPYKPPQMRRVFAAFEAMLHRRAAAGRESYASALAM